MKNQNKIDTDIWILVFLCGTETKNENEKKNIVCGWFVDFFHCE